MQLGRCQNAPVIRVQAEQHLCGVVDCEIPASRAHARRIVTPIDACARSRIRIGKRVCGMLRTARRRLRIHADRAHRLEYILLRQLDILRGQDGAAIRRVIRKSFVDPRQQNPKNSEVVVAVTGIVVVRIDRIGGVLTSRR